MQVSCLGVINARCQYRVQMLACVSCKFMAIHNQLISNNILKCILELLMIWVISGWGCLQWKTAAVLTSRQSRSNWVIQHLFSVTNYTKGLFFHGNKMNLPKTNNYDKTNPWIPCNIHNMGEDIFYIKDRPVDAKSREVTKHFAHIWYLWWLSFFLHFTTLLTHC